MTMVTLTNDFHGSSVTLRCKVLSHIHNVDTAYLSVGQIRKAKKELCGIKGCSCSSDCGVRGRQELDGKRLEINCDAIYAVN